MPRTFLDPDTHREVITRLRSLQPGSPALWGRMDAPRMIAHLSDQMRHTLGELTAAPRNRWLSLPLIKPLFMYWLPWPRGRVKGPPEAFQTAPGEWAADVGRLEDLISRFLNDTGRATWPEHAFFGAMDRQSWGRFCYRHFDHHLRQFGA